MIRVTRDIAIEEKELEFKFVRSSGPGGQNVNKVSTAAELRFDVEGSTNLPNRVKKRLMRIAGSRATRRGEIVLVSSTHRSQEQNRKDVLERLLAMIRQAARRQRPRKKTKRPKWVEKKRVEQKRKRGRLKKQRRGEEP